MNNVGEETEVLHRSFLNTCWKSTSNEIVLAEVDRLPLQIQFWRQILNYYHRTLGLDDKRRLVTLATPKGFAFSEFLIKSGSIAEGVSWPEWH